MVCQFVIREDGTGNNVWSHEWKASLEGNVRAGIAGSDDLITENWLTCASKAVDVNHGLREGLRSFLWQIVTDAACEEAVIVFAGEPFSIRRRGRMRGTVGVAFHGDG